MESSLSNVIKMILEVDETSLTDYSAPDSILTFTAKPPWQSFRRVRPNKIKYDFLDLRIKPRHGQEELITTPSYKRLKPYIVTCALRRLRNFRKYNQRFRHEINQLAINQATAYEEALFYRLMSYTSLWPPLHTYKEIDYTSRKLFPRSRKYMDRLNYLLANDIM